jgi:hypothetical protein
MAPQVLFGAEPTDHDDVFSFGVLLWQMCSCAQPWAGLLQAAVVHAVVHEGQALAWPRQAPPQLAQLGAACMATDPKARPSSTQLAAQLAAMLEGLAQQIEGEF